MLTLANPRTPSWLYQKKKKNNLNRTTKFEFIDITVSQNLKSDMNEGQRLKYILDRSLYVSKMIEGKKSIFYRPVF